MPYVSNQGLKIHYEVEGHGPPLVLQHGITSSTRYWRLCGYTKELSSEYVLILVDARGHGDSGKPYDSQAYSAKHMTSDVVAVLDDLGIEKANYWGYSMGGKIGFQLPRYYPSRFTSYIIGGTSPYPDAGKQIWDLDILRLGAEQGPEAVVSFREKALGRTALPEEKERWRNNDYKALSALFQNMSSWPSIECPAMDHLLPTITVPCLLYAGEKDPHHDGAREAAKHIRNASFFSVPGLEHAEAFIRSDLVLPHAKRFLSNVVAGN